MSCFVSFSLAKAKAGNKDGGYPSGMAYSNWTTTPVPLMTERDWNSETLAQFAALSPVERGKKRTRRDEDTDATADTNYAAGWSLKSRHRRAANRVQPVEEAPSVHLTPKPLLCSLSSVLYEELGEKAEHSLAKEECHRLSEAMGYCTDDTAFEKLWSFMCLGQATPNYRRFADAVRNPLRNAAADRAMCAAAELAIHPFLRSPLRLMDELLNDMWRRAAVPAYGHPLLAEPACLVLQSIISTIDTVVSEERTRIVEEHRRKEFTAKRAVNRGVQHLSAMKGMQKKTLVLPPGVALSPEPPSDDAMSSSEARRRRPVRRAGSLLRQRSSEDAGSSALRQNSWDARETSTTPPAEDDTTATSRSTPSPGVGCFPVTGNTPPPRVSAALVVASRPHLLWNIQVLDELASRMTRPIAWERVAFPLLSGESGWDVLSEETLRFFQLTARYDHSAEMVGSADQRHSPKAAIATQGSLRCNPPNATLGELSLRVGASGGHSSFFRGGSRISWAGNPDSPRGGVPFGTAAGRAVSAPKESAIMQKGETLVGDILLEVSRGESRDAGPQTRVPRRGSRMGSIRETANARRVSTVSITCGGAEESLLETELADIEDLRIDLHKTLDVRRYLEQSGADRVEDDEEAGVFFTPDTLKMRYKTASVIRRLGRVTGKPLSRLACPLSDFLESCRDSFSYLPDIDGFFHLFGPPTLSVQNFSVFVRTRSFQPAFNRALAESHLQHTPTGSFVVYPYAGDDGGGGVWRGDPLTPGEKLDAFLNERRRLAVSFVRTARRRDAGWVRCGSLSSTGTRPRSTPEGKGGGGGGLAGPLRVQFLQQFSNFSKDEKIEKCLSRAVQNAKTPWFLTKPQSETQKKVNQATSYRRPRCDAEEPDSDEEGCIETRVIEHGTIERDSAGCIVFSHGIHSAATVFECIYLHSDVLRHPRGEQYADVPWLEDGLGDGLSPLQRAAMFNNPELVRRMTRSQAFHKPYALDKYLPRGCEGPVPIDEPLVPRRVVALHDSADHVTDYPETMHFPSLTRIEVKMMLQRIARGKYGDDHFLLLVWELGADNGTELLRYCESGAIKGNRLQEAMDWHPLAHDLREDLPAYRTMLHGRRVNKRLSPLHVALQAPATEDPTAVVKVLLDAGCDPNRPDGNGASSLYHGVVRQSVECVTLLLHNGADYRRAGPEPLLLVSLNAKLTEPHPGVACLLAKVCPNHEHLPEAIRLCNDKVRALSVARGERSRRGEHIFRELKARLQELRNSLYGSAP